MSKKAKKNVGGRPTKYNAAMQKTADEYLVGLWVEHGEGDDASTTRVFGVDQTVVPSAEGLARNLDVNRSTLYEWKDKHERFSDTLDAIEALQKIILIDKGLRGLFSPAIAKLMLHNHGLNDRIDKTVATDMKIEVVSDFPD